MYNCSASSSTPPPTQLQKAFKKSLKNATELQHLRAKKIVRDRGADIACLRADSGLTSPKSKPLWHDTTMWMLGLHPHKQRVHICPADSTLVVHPPPAGCNISGLMSAMFQGDLMACAFVQEHLVMSMSTGKPAKCGRLSRHAGVS